MAFDGPLLAAGAVQALANPQPCSIEELYLVSQGSGGSRVQTFGFGSGDVHQISCINKDDRNNPYERITHLGRTSGGEDGGAWRITQPNNLLSLPECR